jgi:hypothetical protein
MCRALCAIPRLSGKSGNASASSPASVLGETFSACFLPDFCLVCDRLIACTGLDWFKQISAG